MRWRLQSICMKCFPFSPKHYLESGDSLDDIDDALSSRLLACACEAGGRDRRSGTGFCVTAGFFELTRSDCDC